MNAKEAVFSSRVFVRQAQTPLIRFVVDLLYDKLWTWTDFHKLRWKGGTLVTEETVRFWW